MKKTFTSNFNFHSSFINTLLSFLNSLIDLIQQLVLHHPHLSFSTFKTLPLTLNVCSKLYRLPYRFVQTKQMYKNPFNINTFLFFHTSSSCLKFIIITKKEYNKKSITKKAYKSITKKVYKKDPTLIVVQC